MTRPPPIRLPKLDALHSDFVRMFARFEQSVLDGSLCRRITSNVHMALNDPRIDADHLFQTLMQYEGRQLDDKWCDLLARQIVARQEELRAGVLHLFERPIRDEWVPMEIYEVEECEWRDRPEGQALTLYCLAGHPAGHRLVKRVPENFLAFLAYRVGFNRRMVYEHEPKCFVGFRLWGLLKVGRGDELDFEEWMVDSPMKKWNQTIHKRRSRFDVDTWQMSDARAAEYSCVYDEQHYCSECRRRVDECVAVPNRERTHGRPVQDPGADHKSGGGQGSQPDPVT